MNLINETSGDLQTEFNNFLQKNQIGELQLLYSKQTEYYFTAPAEILNSLSEFENKQSYFKIKNPGLASVSITFSNSVDKKDLTAMESLLHINKIEIVESFQTKNSLHFLVELQQKNEAIQYLHESIK